MGLLARILLLFGGVVTSWFVARDADNFHVINFVVTMALFVVLVAVLTFRQALVYGVEQIWRRIRGF